jgi:hypothetical protein
MRVPKPASEKCPPARGPVTWEMVAVPVAESITTCGGGVGATGPAGPCGPAGPVSPCGPCGPIGPATPGAPSGPWGPTGPIGPSSPVGPTGPCGPTSPVGPVAPVSPFGPCTFQLNGVSFPLQPFASARRNCPLGRMHALITFVVGALNALYVAPAATPASAVGRAIFKTSDVAVGIVSPCGWTSAPTVVPPSAAVASIPLRHRIATFPGRWVQRGRTLAPS